MQKLYRFDGRKVKPFLVCWFYFLFKVGEDVTCVFAYLCVCIEGHGKEYTSKAEVGRSSSKLGHEEMNKSFH